MRIPGKVKVIVPDQYVCDRCKKDMGTDSGPEFGSLSTHWGYGSKRDLESTDIQLCEDCWTWLEGVLKAAGFDVEVFKKEYTVR